MNQNPFENKSSQQKKSKQEQLAIKFELAKPKDWAKLASIKLEAKEKNPESFIGTPPLGKVYPEEPKKDDEIAWKSRIESDLQFFIFAKNKSDVIGLGYADEDLDDFGSPNGIWDFRLAYVKSEFRGQGIGEKICQTTLEEIKKRGGYKVRGVILSRNKDSGRVKKILEKIGFQEVKKYSKDNSKNILMQWNLTK